MAGHSNIVERIARVLAGRALSVNAEGDDPSAGPSVDELWQDHVEEALSVLRAIREPDQHMASVGDSDTWQRMVEAAIDAEKAVRNASFS